MNIRYYFCYLVLLITAPGCIIGPHQYTPHVCLPKEYAEHRAVTTTTDLATWWHIFEDPILNHLIEQALDCNYSLRIALEKIEEARALYQLQTAQMLPEVNGIGTISRGQRSEWLIQNNINTGSLSTPFTTSPLSYIKLGLEAAWEIDLFGRLRHAKNAACYDYQEQVELMRDVQVILLADVAKNYIDLRTAQQKLLFVNEQIALRIKTQNLAQERLTAGIASEIPFFQEQSLLVDLQSAHTLIQQEEVQARNRLAVLLGIAPHNNFADLTPASIPYAQIPVTAGIPSDLLTRRPDIRRAQKRLAASIERVGYATTDYFPRFSLLGSVATESNFWCAVGKKGSLSWSIGPSMVWPLLTFGRIKANIQVHTARERQAVLAYTETVITALGEVENSLFAYFNQQENVDILLKKKTSVTKERDAVADLFKSGLANQSDLLFMELRYLQTTLEIISAQSAASSALVATYKALGGGW